MRTNCSRRSRRGGLTLIEVVAAIAILGTILVAVVLARTRHARQIALTERKAAAVRAADELITGWWSDPFGPPIDQTDAVSFDPSLTWTTRLVDNEPVQDLGARVLRIEISETEPKTWQAASGHEVLIAVELVIPDPQVEQRELEEAEKRLQPQLPGSGDGTVPVPIGRQE